MQFVVLGPLQVLQVLSQISHKYALAFNQYPSLHLQEASCCKEKLVLHEVQFVAIGPLHVAQVLSQAYNSHSLVFELKKYQLLQSQEESLSKVV